MNIAFLIASLPFFASIAGGAPSDSAHTTFTEPTDALSVTLSSPEAVAEVSYKDADGTWSAWQELAVENEQDPLLRESNLIMFPEEVTDVRFRGSDVTAVHPITLSDDPTSYSVAAISATSRPRILTRSQWGADDSLLVTDKPERQYTDTSSNDSATEQRLDDCAIAQRDYPNEFKTSNRQTTDAAGNRLRWVREYSPSIKVIALHHTAITVSGDKRSGVERMRALYTYHANNRGWGDVGYHYLIDEEGQIYEGKSGGPLVVGGHAYCNNVGTVGIALMGNFEDEQPTQDQLKSSQWLIKNLADRYGIDLQKKVTFHGKTTEPVVGHRDLVSTACPGFYVYGSIAQLHENATKNDVYASVTLPKRPIIRSIASNRTPTKTLEQRVAERAAERTESRAKDAQPRGVQRILNSRASRLLMRKLRSGATENASTTPTTRPTPRVAITRTASSSSASTRNTRVASSISNPIIRIRLTRQENGAPSCDYYNLSAIRSKYRGTVTCTEIDGVAALINEVGMEEYMMGLVEEPDTEPYEKQRAFAIAARSYATHYLEPHNRKFPGMPYDGSDSPATFQLYGGRDYEAPNPRWVQAVQTTAGQVLLKNNEVVKAPYFSSNDGRTRSPAEIGWNNFPFAEVFVSKEDPWCAGMDMRGHGVGMSGCGAEGQANEGRTAEQILSYYYPTTTIDVVR